MADRPLKPGDVVYARYRGRGTIVEPLADDLAKPHFDTDVCVQFVHMRDWLGPNVLELEKE